MTTRALARILVTVLVGAACGLGGTSAALLASGRDEPDDRAGRAVRSGGGAVEAPTPRAVLRQWHAARAAAWSGGDPAALAALYTPGSRAGRTDVIRLRAWKARGLRVTAMTTQVLALRVLAERERRLVLRVTDRLVGVEAGAVTLPRDQVSTRVITLRRSERDRWLVASVTDRPSRSR